MDGTRWYRLNGSDWHVDIGSPGEEHLLAEGAVEIDGPDGEAPKGDDQPKAIASMNKAELVAHAAALDPPLQLDEKSKKDELLAAIDAHEPAAPPAGDGEPPKGDEA